jgi:plastocyanin
VHNAALHLAPILGAEKSKVPFYVAGGALVAWALIVSVGLGLRRPSFPGSLGGERVVIAISAVLVLAAVSSAVITAGVPAKAGAAPRPSAQRSATGEPAKAPTAGTPAGAGGSALKLAANPGGQLSYDAKQLSAKAGKVTVALANASPIEHNLTVARGSAVLGETPTFTGGTRTLTLNLKPGTYAFYCSVPGHRQAGMEGILSVR